MEAGKTLAFTPDALKGLDTPPVLRLRAATWREKEHRFFMHRVVGAVSHGEEAVRAETLNGLRALWTEEQAEQCANHSPVMRVRSVIRLKFA